MMIKFASMECLENTKELYKNKLGAVYQCDTTSKLIVEFGNSIAHLNIPCFLCLKKQTDKLNLEAMAYNMDTDVEIFTPCSTDRCYILSLTEAYYFQDLLAGAKVMLELNRIIHERLYRYSLVS